jgi:hypothetical protein
VLAHPGHVRRPCGQDPSKVTPSRIRSTTVSGESCTTVAAYAGSAAIAPTYERAGGRDPGTPQPGECLRGVETGQVLGQPVGDDAPARRSLGGR